MFSKMRGSKEQILRFVFLFIILFFILFNFKTQLPRFINSIRVLKNYHVRPLGGEFVHLVPFLKNGQRVGYMTCLKSSHPLTDVAVMGPYQQAQYVLAPAILDYFHPFDHQYIILECPGRAAILYRRKGPS